DDVQVQPLPERGTRAADTAPALADTAAEGGETRSYACGGRARGGDREAEAERGEHTNGADAAAHAGEADGAERDGRAERACKQAELEALDARERQQVAPTGAARTQQRKRPPVALRRPQRGEVREPERDERPGHGEHDVERLGIERVAGRCAQVVAQVVDEHDLAGKRALDPVADLRRLPERARG